MLCQFLKKIGSTPKRLVFCCLVFPCVSFPYKHTEGLEVPCKPYGEKGGPLDPWGTLPKDRDIEGERISYGMQKKQQKT